MASSRRPAPSATTTLRQRWLCATRRASAWKSASRSACNSGASAMLSSTLTVEFNSASTAVASARDTASAEASASLPRCAATYAITAMATNASGSSPLAASRNSRKRRELPGTAGFIGLGSRTGRSRRRR
ncbi:hypothetical protein HK414_11665 [Ramlibacter terrae]|uniref:Uncharacterized protein n=1 Tax=Ramlibacter terrae TaxID=2732511 RepID=A0ABX6P2G0_9BURK|nr:hypothetical protein HK414_11665 [Ramlibacter terrae]